MSNNLKVSCTTANLKQIRAFTESSLSGYGVPEEDISLMVLAVDEICANVIIHSNSMNQEKELEIRISHQDDGFVFEICDSGQPFDQSAVPEKDIFAMVKEKRKGGLGLMLVRRIMDSIELKTEKSLTIYRLFKKISPC